MKNRMKGILNKRGKKFWLILTAVILVIAIAAFFILRPLLKGETAKAEVTATVSRGSIIRTIEGSGVIAANDQYTISSLVTGEVLSDTFEEGDMVEKDALLYTIDSTNMDFNIEKAESGVNSARLSYEESLETLDNMTVKAPFTGVITSLSVKEGDEISAGKSVGDMVDADRMLLSLPFLYADAQYIAAGDIATVVPESAPSESLAGTVKSVSTGSMANALGVAVSTVEIWVENPGGLLEGARATATVGTYACNDAGVFSYAESGVITVKTGGTVTSLNVRQGDKVEKGQVLFKLESDSAERSVERSRISYNDSLRSLENTYDQLDDYQIKAPIAGKVIQKSVKAGDKLESGSGGNASSMAIIADLSILTFEMAVDELDISDIREGQVVQVTADAVAGRMFTGKVDNVSIVGTTSNGVTSYPVKVTLDGEENAELIPGMNVSATIIIEQKHNILLIPSSAVSRGNLVCVKGEADASEAASDPAFEKAAFRTEATPEAPVAAPSENADAETPSQDISDEKQSEGDTRTQGGFGGTRPDGMAGKRTESGTPEGGIPSASPDANSTENAETPANNRSMPSTGNYAANRMPTPEAPAGYHYVRIETGITDGTYIEVLSGLSEGDVILLPESQGNANSAVAFTREAQSTMRSMGGMGGMGGMGSMGGGMPMGGSMGGMRR